MTTGRLFVRSSRASQPRRAGLADRIDECASPHSPIADLRSLP